MNNVFNYWTCYVMLWSKVSVDFHKECLGRISGINKQILLSKSASSVSPRDEDDDSSVRVRMLWRLWNVFHLAYGEYMQTLCDTFFDSF